VAVTVPVNIDSDDIHSTVILPSARAAEKAWISGGFREDEQSKFIGLDASSRHTTVTFNVHINAFPFVFAKFLLTSMK
jgi:hypothetical protein